MYSYVWLANFVVMSVIILWSMVVFFIKPSSLYDQGNEFKKRTFHFWLLYWFASLFFYLIKYFTLPLESGSDLGTPNSLFVLAFNLAACDMNSVIALGIYSSYTRGREFNTNIYVRTWLPIFAAIVSYEFICIVIRSYTQKIDSDTIRLIMMTPSLGLSIVAVCSIGWAFYLRLGRGAIIFPMVSITWAFIQVPLYYLFMMKENIQTGQIFLWVIVFLKVLIAVMFFTFIMYKTESQESVIRRFTSIQVPYTFKKIVKYFLYSSGSLLSLLKLIDWLGDLLRH